MSTAGKSYGTVMALFCCALTALPCPWAASQGDAANSLPDGLFPARIEGNIDKAKFREPSGIVFHAARGTLFVVGDEGDIEEISTSGEVIGQAHVSDADFEGVTCDPSTGRLYIVVEGANEVLELSPSDFGVLRTFVIPRTFNGETVMAAGGQGLEAIAFVPDSSHPEGGTFFVTNQGFADSDPADASALVEVRLPLKTGAEVQADAEILRYMPMKVYDLAGLDYDARRGLLIAVSDAANACFELSRDGRVLRTYALPGRDQEGIAFDNQGYAYIAQDSGGILKCKMTHQTAAARKD